MGPADSCVGVEGGDGGDSSSGSHLGSGSAGVIDGGASDSAMEDVLKQMREWQFLAFSLGAVVCFACAALLARFVSSAWCGKSNGRRPPTRTIGLTPKMGRAKRRREKPRHSNDIEDDSGEEEEQHDDSDDDRQGLLDA